MKIGDFLSKMARIWLRFHWFWLDFIMTFHWKLVWKTREIFHWIFGILIINFHWFDPVTAFLFLYHFREFSFNFIIKKPIDWILSWIWCFSYFLSNLISIGFQAVEQVLGYDFRKILFWLQIGFNLILIGFHDLSQLNSIWLGFNIAD